MVGITMKVSGDGFLTELGYEKSAEIVQRNSRVFDALEGNIRLCRSFVLSVDLEGQSTLKERQKIIAIVVAVRILEIAEAAFLILKNGLSNEADTLFRVFLDAYFVFANTCLDPEFVVEFFRSDEAARLKLMNAAGNHSSEIFKLLNEYAKPDLKEELKQKIKDEDIKSFKSVEYAKKAGCAEMYDSIYRLMSAPLHTTPRSLEKYTEEDEDGIVIKIKYYPVEEEIPQRAYDFAYHLIKVIGGLTDIFGNIIETNTKTMIDELNETIDW
jgi:hypothetical protein